MRNGPYELVVAPPDYPGKRYRDRYCYEHHLVYWRKHGVLPKKGEVIHHKDENKRNNADDNLELLTEVDHHQRHRSGVKTGLFKCPWCQTMFERPMRKPAETYQPPHYTSCSHECSGSFIALKRTNLQLFETRVSENVVRVFKTIAR